MGRAVGGSYTTRGLNLCILVVVTEFSSSGEEEYP